MNQETDNHIGTFVIIGPSQSGKSSTINTIAGSRVAAVGTGDGTSVTSDSQIHRLESEYLDCSIDLIDVPGFGDSRLCLSDEDIMNTIKIRATETFSQDRTLKGFILTESLQADSNQIIPNLKTLNEICGDQVKNSLIILTTKSDLMEYFEEKYNGIKDVCLQRNIFLVKWSNKIDLSPEDRDAQITDLKRALNNITPYSSKWMEELKEEIKEIAIKLASQQPLPTQQDIINLAQKLSQEAPEIEKQRLKTVQRERIHREPMINIKRAGFWKRLFRGKDSVQLYYENVKVKVNELESYLVKEKPDYEVFIKIAVEKLEPKPFTDFIEEATIIKSQEIAKRLTRY
jgi:GTP-binding protein EngB required for normal cell division